MKKIGSIVLVGALAINLLSVGSIKASTKSTTPMESWRYAKKTANYQVKSTSDYYKDIWSAADKAWKKNGFDWTKKSSSKTTVSSYEDSSKGGLTIAGVCHTTYRNSDGHIKKNEVLLNRAALDKYNYSKKERIVVAEHELGHALGLAHNNKGSVSVMNPSAKKDEIQNCDKKGMEKRYSTPINNAVIEEKDIKVTTYFKIKKRKITKTKVQYNNGKITICGKAVRCNKVSAKYNGKLKKVKVKSNKFKVTLKYKKAKDITLYGLNKKGEKISTKKVVKKSSYISEKPEYIKITRDDKGITYEFQTEANSVMTVSYKKEKLQKVSIDSSYEVITIKEEDIKGKKGKITFTQTTSGKRVSEKVKLPIINIGETMKKTV